MKQLTRVQLQDAKELTPGQMKDIKGGAGYGTCHASDYVGPLTSGSYPDNMTCTDVEDDLNRMYANMGIHWDCHC